MRVEQAGQAVVESRRWPTRSNLNAIALVALLVAAVAVWVGASKIASAFSPVFFVTLPTSVDVPDTSPTNGAVPGIPTVIGGQFDTATVAAAGLGTSARLLIAAAALVGMLATVLVALAIAYLCRRLRRGDPFIPTLSRAIFVAALTLMIGGVIGQGLTVAGAWLACDELNAARHSHEFVPGGPIDFAPIIAGIVLGVIAAAFRIGERLQRDTEGLV